VNENYDIAVIYIGLGQRDQAFEILNRVYQNHNMNLLSIVNDPRLAGFRADARYSHLIQQVCLPSV
jgi:hypothetical protein